MDNRKVAGEGSILSGGHLSLNIFGHAFSMHSLHFGFLGVFNNFQNIYIYLNMNFNPTTTQKMATNYDFRLLVWKLGEKNHYQGTILLEQAF